MFMTGLVLVMNYYNRQNDWFSFWRKRYTSVGIPYIFWNVVYVAGAMIFTKNIFASSSYSANVIHSIIYGDQFYMYYVLVTFQLYLLFPLIVKLFKTFEGHHLQILITSIVIQLVMLTYIKYGLPHVDTSSWWYLFRAYGLNVFTYQVYFIFGAFVAIHYQEVDQFIQRYATPIKIATAILAVGTIGLYFFDINVLHLSVTKAEEVHQPYIMVYDIVMIAFVFWLGRRYAYWRTHGSPQKVDQFIHNGAKVSFGIYLIQTIPLMMLAGVLKLISLPSWGYLLLVPLGYAGVIAVSFMISMICMKVYPLGILIGRKQTRKEVVIYDKTYERTQKSIN